MISYFKKTATSSLPSHYKKGMTYVELIVVMGIFATMSTIIFFRYSDFNKQIDVQNLSQDIALQIVQAQKYALSGKLHDLSNYLINPLAWKPAYGVYFDITKPNQFIPYVDGNNDTRYDKLVCDPNITECTDLIKIGKGNFIKGLCASNTGNNSCDGQNPPSNVSDISITFTRPDSSAIIKDQAGIVYTQKVVITISDQAQKSIRNISVFAFGRIEVN